MQPATGRPDWERLPPAHLPRPTYWPVVLAFGIMLLAWGIVTTLAISVIGLVIFALGLGGWIGDLRHGAWMSMQRAAFPDAAGSGE